MKWNVVCLLCLVASLSATSGTRAGAPAYTRIRQGSASSAWMLAPMAAVQAAGVDLSRRVFDRGDTNFDVSIFYNNPLERGATTLPPGKYWVVFDGNPSAADPVIKPGDRRDFWVVALQRAIIVQLRAADPSQSFENPPNGDPSDALAMLTGHRPVSVACTAADARQQVEAALTAHQPVVYVTKFHGSRPDLLLYSQPYAVVKSSADTLTIYNPMNYPQCVRRLGGLKHLAWSLALGDGDRFIIGDTHFSKAEQIARKFNLIQQAGSETCWMLAAMVALQYRGVDLSRLVQSKGQNHYRIWLHNYLNPRNRDAGTYCQRVVVDFDGKTINEDPRIRPGDKNAYWVVALHRGVIEAVHQWDPSQTIEKTHGGDASDAFGILAGRRAVTYDAMDPDIRQKVEAALKRSAAITVGLGSHVHTVLDSCGDDLIIHDPYGGTGPTPWATNVMKPGHYIQVFETRVMKKGPNLLQNGSFEVGPEVEGYLPLDPDSTAIKGWKVTRGQIDYVCDGLASADGYRCLDLHGSPGFGGIAQTFKTVRGRRYRVTLSLAGSPDAASPRKRIGVSAAGQRVEFTFDSTGKSAANPGWVVKEWEFDAKAAQTTLEIYTLEKTDEYRGPILDEVRVEPVPGRNLLVNGSFEDGPDDEGWTAVKPGATQMPGWKIVGAEVGFASSLWRAADGRRSLFFPSVPDKGRLQQTFKTKKGQRYRVTFSLSGNPNGGWWSNAEFARTRLAVSAAGQSQEFAFDSAGKSPSDMGWVTKTWEFDATSDRTTLEFSTLDTNRGYWVAPALDNVRVCAAR